MFIWINFADSVHNNAAWKKNKVATYLESMKMISKKRNPSN